MTHGLAAKHDKDPPHLVIVRLAELLPNLLGESVPTELVLLVNQYLNETAAAHLPQLSVAPLYVLEQVAAKAVLHLRHVELADLFGQFAH